MTKLFRHGVLAAALMLPSLSFGGVVVTNVSGANAAAIQAAVDAFRASLGALNANTPGSQPSGRREINWDANGPLDGSSSPNFMSLTFFNQAAAPFARGAEFSTPGAGVTVSQDDDNPADADADQVRFSNLNAAYLGQFQTFSAQRLFAPVGSVVLGINFRVPGSSTVADVSGFGVIFTDVDIAAGGNCTSVEAFNGAKSLGTTCAAAFDGGFSFVGILGTNGDRITSLTIRNGSQVLGAAAENPAGGLDAVAMDDFIYGEPQAVPEPSTVSLLAGGLALVWWRRRR